MLLQQELISRADGVSEMEIEKSMEANARLFEMVIKSNDNNKLKADLINEINEIFTNDSTAEIRNGMTQEEYISTQVDQITSAWMEYFLKFDPAPVLEKVKCPVLAVNGEKDLQVPPKENLTSIKNALEKGGNNKVTTIEFPGLNHLFQECETGSPMEYATIEQTFSPTALEAITSWIKTQTK